MQLNDTSAAVQKALPKLIEKNHESWAKTFKTNLKNWIENAMPKDWDLLASQDINAILNENNFKQALQELLK